MEMSGKIDQEWLEAILAVTEDAMVIEAVRNEQARIDEQSTSQGITK